MSFLLKMFSFQALVAFIVKMKLGTVLWNIVQDAVSVANQAEGMTGEQKFAMAASMIAKQAQDKALSYSQSLLNWAVENAVQIIKEKTS